MTAITRNGLTLEEVSRQCLSDLAAVLEDQSKEEPPPTESDLEEMQAEDEGWGHQWRAEKEEEKIQQAEHEAREREKSRKRKRDEDHLAMILAATAERENEDKTERPCSRTTSGKSGIWQIGGQPVKPYLICEPLAATAVAMVDHSPLVQAYGVSRD